MRNYCCPIWPGLDHLAGELAGYGFNVLSFSSDVVCDAILYNPRLGHSIENIHALSPALLINTDGLNSDQIVYVISHGTYSPLFMNVANKNGLKLIILKDFVTK